MRILLGVLLAFLPIAAQAASALPQQRPEFVMPKSGIALIYAPAEQPGSTRQPILDWHPRHSSFADSMVNMLVDRSFGSGAASALDGNIGYDHALLLGGRILTDSLAKPLCPKKGTCSMDLFYGRRLGKKSRSAFGLEWRHRW